MKQATSHVLDNCRCHRPITHSPHITRKDGLYIVHAVPSLGSRLVMDLPDVVLDFSLSLVATGLHLISVRGDTDIPVYLYDVPRTPRH